MKPGDRGSFMSAYNPLSQRTYTHHKSVFECADDSPIMASLKGPYGEYAQTVCDSIFAID